MNIYVEMTDSHEIDRFSFRCLLIKSLCFPYSQWSLWCLYWQTGHKRRKEGLYKICRLENPRVFFSKNFQNNKILLLLSFLGSQEYSDFFFISYTPSSFVSFVFVFQHLNKAVWFRRVAFGDSWLWSEWKIKCHQPIFGDHFFPSLIFFLLGFVGTKNLQNLTTLYYLRVDKALLGIPWFFRNVIPLQMLQVNCDDFHLRHEMCHELGIIPALHSF